MTHLREEVPAVLSGERVDRLVALLTGCSRSEATEAVRAELVRINGAVVAKGSSRVESGDVIELETDPHRVPVYPTADPEVQFQVVYDDDQIVVVDKPAGLVVHPGPGHVGSTLVNGLLARYPEVSGVGEPHRPGLVHRLDRGTSGLLVVARTPEAHRDLVDQLSSHSVERVYTALVWGHPQHSQGVIDAPIGRSRRDPLRMTVAMDGRQSRTAYRVDNTYNDPITAARLTCELETGRTHQIRVHVRSIGHPVIGDDLYGGRRENFVVPRPMLHARRLSFLHPGTESTVSFESEMPDDLSEVFARLS